MTPNILLSNDDGIYSNGIKTIAKEMYSRKWDITIIAPHLQRSGEAKAITFDFPIRMQEIPLSFMILKKGCSFDFFFKAKKLTKMFFTLAVSDKKPLFSNPAK